MQKTVWVLIGFCFFLFITALAISTKDLNYGKRVNFVNVSLSVRNSNNKIISQTTTLPGQVVTQNYTQTTTNPVAVDVNTVSHETKYSAQATSRNDKYTKVYKYDTTPLKYKNIDDTELDNALKSSPITKTSKKENLTQIPKYKTTSNNSENLYPDDVEYAYDNIDWSKWKSNFVNKILDDSVAITELDKYPNGAFFYYSFIVDYEGRISNVNVRSVYLSEQDKQIVANFIKGYAHKPITRFPAKTNRKTARISAIMMLSSAGTVHSKPSDFTDTERIKYQVK